mgnify:CR=1 FL=1
MINLEQKIKNAMLIKKAKTAVKALRGVDLGGFDPDLERDFTSVISDAIELLNQASDMNSEAAGE